MAIYYMNSKTFFKIFLKEDPEKILKSQYVIVSESIKRGDSYKKQVIVATKFLYPTDDALASFGLSESHYEFKERYRYQLNTYGQTLLATLVKSVLEENYTIILLCTKRDDRFGFMKMIAEWVEEYLSFPIYDYKAYKEGKEKMREYNPSTTLKLCNKVIENASKENKKKKMKSSRGRKELLSQMTKKEKKKMLKKMNLYTPSMTKKEIDEMLETFFVDD